MIKKLLVYSLLFICVFVITAKGNAQIKKDSLQPNKKTNINQKTIIGKDTTITIMDTVIEDKSKGQTKFYKKLKEKASKNKITKELYRLIFASNKKAINNIEELNQSDLPFRAYNGKIIRKIIVKVFEPFGATLNDTSRTADSWLERTANTLHLKSNVKSILKAIHLKKGERIDALDLADNERLLRNLDYVYDACIKIVPCSENKNEVDVYLWIKDKFSWGGNINFGSLSKTSVEIYNNNLYGAGHQFESKLILDRKKNQKFGNAGSYTIPNIFKSYFNVRLGYNYLYNKHDATLSVEKLFETYSTKWAGGVTLNKTNRSETLTNIDPIDNDYFLNFNYWNTWYGYSFPLKSPREFARRKLFLTGKIQQYTFIKRPETDALINKYFHNYTLFLSALSISQVQYYKSNLIYNFGRIEDVPYGFLAQFNLGYEHGEFRNRFYTALQIELATRLKKTRSYLYNKLGLGTFFTKNGIEQGVFCAKSQFISRIRRIGNFNFRNFGSIEYVMGINRFPEEFITLNKRNGIRGFDSKKVRGSKKLKFSLETVAFTPYRWLGFQFAFFSFLDGGLIYGHPSKEKDFYYSIGLGTRIHNANLVFKTLQIRFAFYPKTPADFRHLGFSVIGEKRPRLRNFNVQDPNTIPFQ